MKKIAFITGITGQDASYLAELLLEKDYEVHGLIRRVAIENQKERLSRISHVKDKIKLHYGTLESYPRICQIIEKIKPDECYHLAANSFVKVSFEDEFSTMNTNINGTHHILSAIKRYVPKCKTYLACCYSEDTKILTKRGLKNINEVSVGDKIYTLNIKNKNMELKPIKNIIKQQYEGKMINFKNKIIDLLVTPNHQLLLEKNNKLFYEKAQVLKDSFSKSRKSITTFPSPNWMGLSKDVIDFKNWIDFKLIPYNTKKNVIKKMQTNDFFYLLGAYIGDGYVKNYIYSAGMSAKDFIKRKDAMGRFIKNNKKSMKIKRKGNFVYFAIPKKDPARKKIINVLQKYKIIYYLDDDTIRFSSISLSKMFLQTGMNCYNKKIPQWTLDYSKKYLLSLYDGLIDSDGHRRSTRDTYATVSFKLIESMAELVLKLGFIPVVRKRKGKPVFYKKEKRYINSGISYDLNISRKMKRNIYGYNIKKIDYKGEVWCLTMQDNNNFIVERKGRFYFCGNSSEMFGKVQEIPQTEKTPFYPRSIYGITKVTDFYLAQYYREAHNLFACSGILFNHGGERRSVEFVTRKITNAVARIKLGKQEKLRLGNIESKRDWGHSRDYVYAQWLMLQQDKPDDFVIATNEVHSVKEFLQEAFSYVALNWKDYVIIDPEFYRPADVNLLIGDYSKAKKILKWEPKIRFKELVRLMVDNDLKIEQEIK